MGIKYKQVGLEARVAFTNRPLGGSCSAMAKRPSLGLVATMRYGPISWRNDEDAGIADLNWRASLLLQSVSNNSLRWVGRPKRSQAGWRLKLSLSQSARKRSIDLSIIDCPKGLLEPLFVALRIRSAHRSPGAPQANPHRGSILDADTGSMFNAY